MTQFRIGLPTVLTLVRLIVSPLVLPVLLVYLLPLNSFIINSVLAGLFVIFALTDFFDGYLARRMQQETMLGRVLDPMADKFLIYATLIALLATDKIYFYWVIIFIGREFFIMGLRHIALERSFSVHVSFWGKLKTIAQCIYLAFLILNPYQILGLKGAPYWYVTELVMLGIALWLTIFSAWRYYGDFSGQLRVHVLTKGNKHTSHKGT
jgi:cardiolipin synthase